jgi:hypothetical protein
MGVSPIALHLKMIYEESLSGFTLKDTSAGLAKKIKY